MTKLEKLDGIILGLDLNVLDMTSVVEAGVDFDVKKPWSRALHFYL